jgi:membrane-associated phospholipid phosphatase
MSLRGRRSGRGEADQSARRRALVAEVVILAVAIAVFAKVHASVGLDGAVATTNARHLQSVERALHADVEPAANRWLVGHPALAIAAVCFYRLYYLAFIGVVVWAWMRHRATYIKVRQLLLAMAAIALLVYWAVPLSPPRFSLPGIVDVVTQHDIFPGSGEPTDRTTGPYSAMPSLHVGWSAWCSYTVWAALRSTRPFLAWAAWLFPALMTLVVIGTGAHYILDVVGTAVLLAISILATSLWRRLRARLHQLPT